MAYTLSNKYAKNLCKRTVPLQLIIKNVVTCFLGTQCISKLIVTNYIKIVHCPGVSSCKSNLINRDAIRKLEIEVVVNAVDYMWTESHHAAAACSLLRRCAYLY